LLFSKKEEKEREQGIGERRERGERVIGTVIVVIIF